MAAAQGKADALTSFLKEAQEFPWIAHAGSPYEGAIVVGGVVEAWDDWSDKMFDVWRPRTELIEEMARSELGEAAIDQVFEVVAVTLSPAILRGLTSYFEGKTAGKKKVDVAIDDELYGELVDVMVRDMCWAAVETLLNRKGFFTRLVEYYREGRWPCSWDGSYPEGRVVLL